jgi:tripartite-type tricarboxylate transporter receptor subunit TctC
MSWKQHGPRAGIAVARASLLLGLLATHVHTGAHAQPVEDFYRGKTITMIISAGAGEGFDANGRLLARHIGRHIPGNPGIIVRNMPGAGHVLASNYLATEAPRDGTVIGSVAPSIISHQLLDGRGVRYDIGKFQWLGSTDFSNQTVYVSAASGVKTFAETMRREVTLGATGAGSYTLLYPTLMNNLLGTRFKAVSGYKAARDIDLAMQRGEVDGRAGNYLSSVKAFYADMLRDGKIVLLVQIGRERDPEFADVPLLTDFAPNLDTKRVLKIFEADVDAGRPFLVPQEVPAERVAALRRALELTVADEAFRAEARKMGLEINHLSAEKLQALIQDVVDTPAELIAIARRAKGEQ